MNNGSLILVNTNVDLLKEDGMTLFGRYIIANALSAAFQRRKIPLEKRVPTVLVIDEAAPYFDETFERLFTRARQFKLATIVAFQHLEQASERMKSALFSSTRVKYAGYLNTRDRERLAQEMETTSQFISSLKKDLRDRDNPEWSQFAYYVKPDFQTACIKNVTFRKLDRMRKVSDEEYEEFLRSNKQQLTSPDPLHDDKQQAQKPPEGDLRGAATVAPSASTVPEYQQF